MNFYIAYLLLKLYSPGIGLACLLLSSYRSLRLRMQISERA
jgi:hypothetical protein